MGTLAELAAGLDASLFARRLGIIPDPWQADVLRSRSDRMLLNCSRQSGKSTIVAALANHVALYEPGSLILLVSPSQRQSQELFKKVVAFWRRLGRPVPPETENLLTLELENGSRVISLPGKDATIRGYSGARLIAIDEAARVGDDLYFAVRPMLAVSRGRLIAASTPFGTRGWWYDAWRSAHDWDRFEVPATQCPRIDPAFLEEERHALGEWFYRQEYECVFSDADTTAFPGHEIEACMVEGVRTWHHVLSSAWT